jgi:DNA-binding CsgD family transcriptional regulator
MQFTEGSPEVGRQSPGGESLSGLCGGLLAEWLDCAGLAALVVNSRREVVLATPRAQAQLHGAAPMRIRAGRLTFATAAEQQRMGRLIDEAIGHATTERGARARFSRVLPVPRHGHLPWIVLVCASHAAHASALDGPVALLLVHDPEQRSLHAPVLAELFGFTSAEAVVAAHLASGLSVAEVAQRQGVSVATVRTQVARLLSKTHTCRQGELLSLLWRVAGGVGGSR